MKIKKKDLGNKKGVNYLLSSDQHCGEPVLRCTWTLSTSVAAAFTYSLMWQKLAGRFLS